MSSVDLPPWLRKTLDTYGPDGLAHSEDHRFFAAYFDTFSERVQTRLHPTDPVPEWLDAALQEADPLSTQEDEDLYFRRFPHRVRERIRQEEERRAWFPEGSVRLAPALALATVMLVAVLAVFALRAPSDQPTLPSVASLEAYWKLQTDLTGYEPMTLILDQTTMPLPIVPDSYNEAAELQFVLDRLRLN